MSETTTGVKWEKYDDNGGLIYHGQGFYARVMDEFRWLARIGDKLVEDNFAPDHATAKQQAERWILEREGRLCTPATDGGWIACSERLPAVGVDVEVITYGSIGPCGWVWDGRPTCWRPRGVDSHADAACLFSDRYRPTVEQARSAARHVAGCSECRAKLEEKGGA